MTSPLLLAQQIFSTFTRNHGPVNPPLCPTNTSLTPTNATIPATYPYLPDALPMDFASLINLLVSFSALREWVKIFFLGALLDLLRRLVVHLYHKFYQSFFITGAFLINDYEAYSWIDSWLKQQKPWKLAHDMDISADPTTDETDISLAFSFDDEAKVPARRPKVWILPTATSGISLWYKRHWVRAIRIVETDSQGVESSRMLSITILAWSRKFLDRLMLDAKKAHELSAHQTVCVYVSKFKYSEYQWWHIACRAKRPLQSIVLDPGIRDTLLDDARDFLASKRWYDCRGIPFRRGYLLYGAPGSGKSSIIHSIAGELKLNVYVMSLSGIGLDDDGFRELISTLPSRCILLLEDIDVALSNTLNREPEKKQGKPSTSTTTSAPVSAPPPSPRSRVTLSGLLNALDGITASEGRVLFATTNKYDALDPALCRPGRMDMHVEFKLASRYQAVELFKYFYTPERHQAKTDADSGDDQKGITDADSSHLSEVVKVGGTLHRHQLPALSLSELSALAERFSDAIPDREFSMASLQGYLMRYKTDPHVAAIGMAAWVAKETEAREK